MSTSTQANRERNVGVLQVLTDNHDSLTQPRPIDHYLYFHTDAARAAFITSLPSGFTVAGQDEREESDERFALALVQHAVPTLERMNAATDTLVVLAEEAGGIYDGWGCPVVPEPKRGLLSRLFGR